MNIYLYGTPGLVGGAATKIRHLLRLLHRRLRIAVVLPHTQSRRDKGLIRFLDELGVSYCLLRDLPARVSGVLLAVCEPQFFSSSVARRLKEKGLQIVWSNEMMWPFKGEAEAVKEGLVDRVLWVSEFQKLALQTVHQGVPGFMVGNYIDPDDFAWQPRSNSTFSIGRISRPDPVKYPLNFPHFYESFGINDIRFRVMAWSNSLSAQYRWHRFDHRWELLAANKMSTRELLYGLDLFVYPLGHRVEESWGRSVVEAMLTGCPPLVPAGHQFHKLLVHGDSGYICDSFDEWKGAVQRLYFDYAFRVQMGKRSSDYARTVHCEPETHRERWICALS